jgi:hypothetical protein
MPSVAAILEDQVIHIKRGRTNGLGFEPAFNSYFDFYVSPKYIKPQLLQLEDVAFHLFLRKNLNDNNPQWRMPSIRQMMRRLGVGQHKIEAMMHRLSDAHLLEKVSGYRRGVEGENIPNHYILSDPLPTLEEFLLVAASGAFGRPLNAEWQRYVEEFDPCTQNGYTPYSNLLQPPVAGTATYKQTSKKEQGTSWESELWNAVLETLENQLPRATFDTFVRDTRLISLQDGVATIELGNTSAKDWIENRLVKLLKWHLITEGKVLGLKFEKVEKLDFLCGER